MTSIRADLGQYLKEQRQHAKLSLRQLADVAGVSNPYLSQIERGLKRPSAEILQSLATGLRISAESLYVRAGLLDEQDPDQQPARAALLADPVLTERQKRVLLDIYATFAAENARDHAPAPAPEDAAGRTTAPTRRTSTTGTSSTRKTSTRKTSTRKTSTRKTSTGKPATGRASTSTPGAGSAARQSTTRRSTS